MNIFLQRESSTLQNVFLLLNLITMTKQKSLWARFILRILTRRMCLKFYVTKIVKFVTLSTINIQLKEAR